MPFDPQVNPPFAAPYGAPLVNFGGLAQLPEDAFAATQRQRALAMQRAFPNGVPMKNGQPDIDAIVNTGARLGGLDYLSGLLPYMYGAQMGEGSSSAINAAIPPAGATGNGQAGSPAAMRATPQPPPQGQPQTNVNATNARPDEMTMQGNGTFENPYMPRSRTDYNEIPDGAWYRASGSTAPVAKGYEGRRPPKDAAIDQPTEESASPANATNNGPNVRPTQVAASGPPFAPGNINAPAGGPTSGAPAPVAGNPGPIAAPNARGETPPVREAQAAQLPNAAAGLVPPGYDPNAFAQALTQRAAQLRAQAASLASRALPHAPNIGANQAKVLQEQAQALDDRAKQIFDVLGKAGEPTPEQKNAAASGTASPLKFEQTKAARVEDAQADAKAFNADYVNISAMGRNAGASGIPRIEMLKSLTLQPGFYSGPFAHNVQAYQQFKSIFGKDPTSALPAEAFQKEINDLLQEQIRAMGKSGVGRVLQAEVQIMSKSIASMENTAAGNRAQLEMLRRVYEEQQSTAQIADQVKEAVASGRIGAGQYQSTLNAAISQHQKAHTLFQPQEVQHPQLLSAPDAPPDFDKWSLEQRQAWEHQAGVKAGDPLRVAGRYVKAQ